ncbi:MAG: cobalamin-binding protein [Verrucomicrobiales bacterium]|nr:cobalamin-binding protein [Verrucomicrobiales bacterium]
MANHRIVSLLPAATEIVCGLGCEDQLVGRSHECDYPPGVESTPACTSSRIQDDGTSSGIDQSMKVLSQESQSLFALDVEQIHSLKPDTIIAQAQCDVCAVAEQDVKSMIGDWPGKAPRLVTLHTTRFAHLWEDIAAVAEALHVKEQGRNYTKALKTRLVDVIEKASRVSNQARVLCVEWIDPLMAAGNWIPDLIGMVIAENLVSKAGEHSGWMTMDEIVAAKPEVIILMPCGFGLERTRKEAEQLWQNSDWQKLKAVKKRRVFAVDGNAYFNRPGPRLVDSLEILGEILYPGLLDVTHEGRAWLRIQS